MAKKITEETALKYQVSDYLSYSGWFHFHCLQGLGCYPGIPDKIAIKDNIVLFIELKSSKGKQSDNQKKFQERLESRGGHYLLIRSIEQLEDAIVEITGCKRGLLL